MVAALLDHGAHDRGVLQPGSAHVDAVVSPDEKNVVEGHTGADLGFEALGPDGMLWGDDAPDGGLFHRYAMFTPASSIAGGTDEVLRDLTRLATHGTVASLVAMECAADLQCRGANEFLVDNLAHHEPLVRRHAAWRLRSRPASPAGYAPLIAHLVSGGIDTLHAYRTLRRWAQTDPDGIFQFASRVLELTEDGPARARLVDLLEQSADGMVILKADTSTQHGQVVRDGGLADVA